MAELDFDALGAQYRDAKASIAEHRIKQARAETAHAAICQDLLRRGQPLHESAELADAQTAVARAVADVEWCRAVMVAAAEAFKGESLETAVERNEAHRSEIGRRRVQGYERPEDW